MLITLSQSAFVAASGTTVLFVLTDLLCAAFVLIASRFVI
jgi:hypothetical protein